MQSVHNLHFIISHPSTIFRSHGAGRVHPSTIFRTYGTGRERRVIIYYFADPLSRKDQQNKSALQQRAKGTKGFIMVFLIPQGDSGIKKSTMSLGQYNSIQILEPSPSYLLELIKVNCFPPKPSLLLTERLIVALGQALYQNVRV